jgi:UDP-2,3-diacylglucosamine pyrophosphatase LpxH
MLASEIITQNLDTLIREAPRHPLTATDKWVIFSDLHLGDGGPNDDFLPNADLFTYVLEQQYLRQGYSLVLNGDVEELQRYTYAQVARQWGNVYALFDAFFRQGRLVKIVGNHDYDLILKTNKASPYPHHNAFVLTYGAHELLLFHGHQASLYYTRHNALIGFFLRYFAQPLGINNYSVAFDSRKQFKIEKRVYEYASRRKIAALIGHTHRPLFESMSKIDSLKFQIETLLRQYPSLPPAEAGAIEKKVVAFRNELLKVNASKKSSLAGSSRYSTDILIPCLFNSGCTISRSGITCLEISGESLALVHYFDGRVKVARPGESTGPGVVLGNSPYHRVVIQQEPLSYIFSRISLLA